MVKVDSGGSLLTGGSRVETGPLLTGVEEGGHPMPDKRQESPVTLGSGMLLSRGD